VRAYVCRDGYLAHSVILLLGEPFVLCFHSFVRCNNLGTSIYMHVGMSSDRHLPVAVTSTFSRLLGI
jgi:hypothetical protein